MVVVVAWMHASVCVGGGVVVVVGGGGCGGGSGGGGYVCGVLCV